MFSQMITYQICLNGNRHLKLNFFKFPFSSLPDILKILLLDLNISEEVKLCPVAEKKYFAEYLIYNVSMIHHIHFRGDQKVHKTTWEPWATLISWEAMFVIQPFLKTVFHNFLQLWSLVTVKIVHTQFLCQVCFNFATFTVFITRVIFTCSLK